MQRQFILADRSRYPWIFLTLAIFANGFIFYVVPSHKSIELLVPTTGVVAAFVYFLYAQHLQETRLFVELFQQFNERYDRLNDRLNEIVSRGQQSMLSAQDRQILFDYFNLCAEEYLYFKSGYIERQVWRSWVNGMRYYSKSVDVLHLWEEELKSDSYYGFSLALFNEELKDRR